MDNTIASFVAQKLKDSSKGEETYAILLLLCNSEHFRVKNGRSA
tara:strand:+ start:286 stop:417 length:132 start_codon:yes stop_codon:yes gene_type:complete